ncbi:dynein axonemal assembly factor 1-like [Daktulosphaira vitifoliae]|uniref:dynein axonemal assembly factor 1-like n=1 Tax=Daktulosphaira vitifoliae TaxID=58002 RepID=UPI0021AA6046|nr:dynein axonemal assembly factor 1-like [Daktulosphaira vitifoliae]
MTKEALLLSCKQNDLYSTPYLNDVLYLHFKGYSVIENLEEYTGLKSLWLENNGLTKISGLDQQKKLVFRKMKSLRVLTLIGNPIITEIKNYRKTLILKCLELLNLDNRSISKKDRVCTEAWNIGGLEAEQIMRTQLINEERQRMNESVSALLKLRDDHIINQIDTQLEPNKIKNYTFECNEKKSEDKIKTFSTDQKITDSYHDEYAMKSSNINRVHDICIIKEAEHIKTSTTTNKITSNTSDKSLYKLSLNKCKANVNVEPKDMFCRNKINKHIVEIDQHTCSGDFSQRIKNINLNVL